MLIFWKFSCLYGNGQKIQPARLISLFTFFYIPRTGNCSMGIFNNTSHLILFSYSLNINLILNFLKAKIICHNIKNESSEDGRKGIIVIFGFGWFSELFWLIHNLKLKCQFDIVYSYLHTLFLSKSDIFYVIINSIHVFKENITCFSGPFYE